VLREIQKLEPGYNIMTAPREERSDQSIIDSVTQLEGTLFRLRLQSGPLDATGRPYYSPNYSVWFETTIRPETYRRSDANHFRQANRALNSAFEADREEITAGNAELFARLQCEPGFARAMEAKYPGIIEHVRPGPRDGMSPEAPPGLTWHHVKGRPGVLQLVPTAQHQSGGPVQQSLHPEGTGGRADWGGGSANR